MNAIKLSSPLAILILVASCAGESGSDGANSPTAAPSTVSERAVTTSTAVPLTTAEAPMPTPPPDLVITAADYEYLGVPEIVPSGTTIRLVNASTSEFHSAYIIRLPEGDERTEAELTALSPQDLLPHYGPGRGVMQVVIYARPGESQYSMDLGGPRVRAPGRYVIMCFIPVDADPAEMEDQVPWGPPRQTEGVPRHDQVGMFAEFTVEG
jgi:hypothetical protein